MENKSNHEGTKSRSGFRLLKPLRVFVASWFIFLCFGAQAQELPPHPRLLLGRKDVEQLKEKIAGPFAAQWKEFRAGVDDAMKDPIELPPRGGNWSHNYVCPEHGARLKQGKKIGPWQWEHICPVGPHTLRGDPSKATTDFDGNGIMGAHLDYADELIRLGVVYQVTGDEKYARRSREILLAYANKYQSYPLHDNQGRPGSGGHVASQSLTEASWLIQVVQGADLVWDTLSDADRAAVADKMLRPALNECILNHNLGIHNIQCRHNSAIGLTGFLLDDKELLHTAIDDPKSGFRTQIAKGVRDDGMWLEGSGGYHFFTIDGLWPLAEAARHCGIDLYTPRFKSMFDGPLNLAMPDLRLPNFNDSGVVELSSRSDQYELAYARWKDPNYLSLISANDRKGRLALLYGAPDLKASDAAPEVRRRGGSRNLPPSGFAILEQATNDDASWLCLKYGPHGGGHGHFDKNHFILWSHGAILMPDAGTHAYGSPLHSTWDKTSLAHNTLTVDEKSQDPSEGKCLAFGTSNGVDFAVTDAGPIYKDANVRFVRSVAMINPNLIVVIDQIHADAEHTLDLAVHVSGAWTDVPAGKPWPAPQVPGYRVLEDLQTRPAGELVARAELAPNHHTCITLAGNESSEIITGTGVGETTKDRVPIAIFRRHAKSTTYVWAIALDGTAQKLDSKPLPNEGIEVRVNGSVRIVANPNGDPLFEVRKD